MRRFRIDQRDVKMGNEDEWTLVVNSALNEAHVHHWWSHRHGSFDFKSGAVDLSLSEFKQRDARRYDMVVNKLREIGFRGAIP